jgi:hypothetical protein
MSVNGDDVTGGGSAVVVFEQATGVVMAQMGMDARQARVCLYTEAVTIGRNVLEVAADLVARRLRMTSRGLTDEPG